MADALNPYPGVLSAFAAWLEQARMEARMDEPLRRCTRCTPPHRPEFRTPVMIDHEGR